MATTTTKTTKTKATKLKATDEAVVPEAPIVTVTRDESAPVAVVVEPDVVDEPAEFVLLELHERDDTYWGGRLTFPNGDQMSMHAPQRRGVEGSAYRVINAKAPTLPVVIKIV